MSKGLLELLARALGARDPDGDTPDCAASGGVGREGESSPRITFTVLPSPGPGDPPLRFPKRGDPPDPALYGSDAGTEWRNREWSADDPIPERAAVIGRVRRTFARLRFPLTVEGVQQEFREADEPFSILRRNGVFLSGGRNYAAMFIALIDLWNYTERRELGGRSPVETLRRRLLATGEPAGRADLEASSIAITEHNLDFLRESGPGKSG